MRRAEGGNISYAEYCIYAASRLSRKEYFKNAYRISRAREDFNPGMHSQRARRPGVTNELTARYWTVVTLPGSDACAGLSLIVRCGVTVQGRVPMFLAQRS
jgi:hypothetical protein